MSGSRMETLRASMRTDGERQQRLQKALEAAEADLVRQQAAHQVAEQEFRELARRSAATPIEQLHKVDQRRRDAELLARVAEARVAALEEELQRLAAGTTAIQRGLDDVSLEAAELAAEIVTGTRQLEDQHEKLTDEWHHLKAWAQKLEAKDRYLAAQRADLARLVGADRASGMLGAFAAATPLPKPWGVSPGGTRA